MDIKILDLTRQYNIIQKKVEPVVLEQMRSGMYIGGTAVADFEKKFSDYIGVKHAIAVNSGTDALVIVLKALGIGAGDEVITTPFSFFATAEAIAMTGAVPVFVDVQEDTYNIDTAKIEEKVNAHTKAILPVHIFGQPADMERILAIAEKYHLFVVEDACQAVGASVGNQKAGALGNAGCFSFFPTKNLGCFGDGGMITTDDDAAAAVCCAFREHGGAYNGVRAKRILEGSGKLPVENKTANTLYDPYKYYNYLVGYNSRLDAVQARILDIKLDYLDDFNRKRAQIADFYNHAFEKIKELQIPQVRDGVSPVWHQYAFRCQDKEAMGSFLSSQGIGSAAFYPVPLHLQKAFDDLGYKEGDLPVAEKITRQTVCLPIYPELTTEELAYIVRGVKKFYGK